MIGSGFIKLRSDDNVVIALRPLSAGSDIEGVPRALAGQIQPGHKIACAPIAKGENVYRYGQVIGQAKTDIQPGEHVHSHNLG
ncbi:MAG: UxaA family hydrolase, partial [Pseudomonadota bacterium]